MVYDLLKGRVSRERKYGMHYSDERPGTLFSMLTGAAEKEDGDPGNDRKKLKKGETDPARACVPTTFSPCRKF